MLVVLCHCWGSRTGLLYYSNNKYFWIIGSLCTYCQCGGPGSGMGNISRSGSGIRIQEHFGSFFRELRNNFYVKILEFFDADADPGIFLTWTGIKKIRIRDTHPGSATLHTISTSICRSSGLLFSHITQYCGSGSGVGSRINHSGSG
jgi:hypothetical protein